MTASPPPLGLLRVHGAPGSGKSLLITALADALRTRGVRTLTAEALTAPGGATAVALTLPGGGRLTLDGPATFAELRAIARSADPTATLLIVEERAAAAPTTAGPTTAGPTTAGPTTEAQPVAGDAPATPPRPDSPGAASRTGEPSLLLLVGDGPAAGAEPPAGAGTAVLARVTLAEAQAAFAAAASGAPGPGAPSPGAALLDRLAARVAAEVAGREPTAAATGMSGAPRAAEPAGDAAGTGEQKGNKRRGKTGAPAERRGPRNAAARLWRRVRG